MNFVFKRHVSIVENDRIGRSRLKVGYRQEFYLGKNILNGIQIDGPRNDL